MNSEKYMLNPNIRCIICNEDEVLIKHGIRSSFSMILKDAKKTRILGKVLKYLRQPISIDGLCAEGRIAKEEIEEVNNLIQALREKNIVSSPSENLQEIYFKTILKGKKDGNLSDRRFGVIGVGDLGRRVVANLLNVKPANMMFYDERVLSSKLLDMNFFINPLCNIEIGSTYVDSLKLYLANLGITSVNGVTGSFDDEDKIKNLFEESDFIVVCLEFFSPKLLHAVNKIAVSEGKPWMSVLIDGSLAIVGPIFIPGETLCYSEFEVQLESSIQHFDEYSLYREYLLEEKTSMPILSPLVDIVSGYASIFIIRFFLKKASSLLESAIFINFEDMSIDNQKLLKLPRCSVCTNTKQPYKSSFV